VVPTSDHEPDSSGEAFAYRRVVLGIGNPGTEYEHTRHNAGFMVLDRLAEQVGTSFRRLERRTPDGRKLFGGRTKAHVALWEGDGDQGPSLLVKPLTYVNLSGDVAGPLLRLHGLTPDALFVVVDDLNLPLGRIRVRPSGSSGGHNGLKSISSALGSDEYPRLRLGIGRPSDVDQGVSLSSGSESTVDFVLARFQQDERKVLQSVVERCALVLREWCGGAAIETLMGHHNGWSPADEAGAAAVDRPGDPLS
jgi:PTH1 family peptidyl-tRNA hydrolase